MSVGQSRGQRPLPEDLKRRWKEYLDRGGDPEQRVEEFMASWTYPPTRQGQQLRQQRKQFWTGIFRDRDLERLARVQYASDETPREPIQKVEAFLLSRWPAINAWYRLFDPGHGQTACYYRDQYVKISEEAEAPAIFVSWYDAWVFCRWAHWRGRGCLLPREYQWEYAAKAGTAWDLSYWWGEEFDAAKCNADNRVNHATPPTPAHANPWGFEDMLGNVWEWCDDEYRRSYDRDARPDSSARVLRGGSWSNLAWDARSADRYDWRPSSSVNFAGFRVARALQ